MTDKQTSRRTFMGLVGAAGLSTATSGVASARFNREPGLPVRIIDSPRTVSLDDSISIRVKVVNNGVRTVSDTVRLRISGYKHLASKRVELDKKSSDTVTFDVSLGGGEGGAPGLRDSHFVVSSREGLDSAPVTIKRDQGIPVDIVDVPDSIKPGEEYSVGIRVTNDNTDRTTVPIQLLDDNDSSYYSFRSNGKTQEVSLDPGETTVITMSKRETRTYLLGDVVLTAKSPTHQDKARVSTERGWGGSLFGW